jgi:hypothetical protein
MAFERSAGWVRLLLRLVREEREQVRVDVLPPAGQWRGDMRSVEPDAKAWMVYFNGEEFARVERRDDVAAALLGQGVLECPAGKRGLLAAVRSFLGHG